MTSFHVHTPRKRVRVMLYRKHAASPYYARFSFKGKPYHRGTDADTETAARAVARRIVEQMAEDQPAKFTEPLSALVESYITERPPTQSARSRLRKFAAHSADVVFATLPRREASATVQAYLGTRASKSALTVRSDQLAISRFCTWLIKTGKAHWESNPAAALHMDLPPVESRTKPHLNDKEVRAVLAESAGDLRPVILLCLGAGLRPREATRAKPEDLDAKTGTMKVFGKRRERTIHLNEWLRRELDGLLPYRFNYYRAFEQFGELRKANGWPMHVSLQALRRTAARAAAPKMSMIQYANYFGHSLEVAHRHYIGYGLIGNKAAVNALDFSGLERGKRKNRTQNRTRRKPQKRRKK